MLFKWLAETGAAGLTVYAQEPIDGQYRWTDDASEAKTFETEAECQAWIDEHFTPGDRVKAIEHGFVTV